MIRSSRISRLAAQDLLRSKIVSNGQRLVVANMSTNNVKTSSSIDFTDTQKAFKAKSMFDLVRGVTVFSLCRVKPLVTNAETLMKLSYKVLRKNITNTALRATFFGHFCAGEDEKSIEPTVRKLEEHGVGSILDYAAEADIEEESTKVPESTTVDKVEARVYDYKGEALCDAHMDTFDRAIRSVKNVSPTGFAAIKCTALGNPELLRRASDTLTEVKKLFYKLDTAGTGFVTKEAFLQTFSKKIEGKDVLTYFNNIDADHDGKIDYIEWTNGLVLEDLHLLTEHCTEQGPLSAAVLTPEERDLMRAMRKRINTLAELAQSLGVRLMIDAEHTYFQPAIDNLTNDLSKRFNRSGQFPVIFSTYQMYLKDSYHRLITDVDRAHKGGYKFAAKLVRGAYMVIERKHAEKNGLDDPIQPSIQSTHDNYNKGVREVVSRMAKGHDVEIMIASHNQQSIEKAVECMEEYKLPPSSPVYFGQLLGMSDNLTFCLADKGYKAYKYVPYGKINEVMPYLIRRAQENSDALGGAQIALTMSKKEVKRRIFG